eukprot:5965505-Pyramimonas_sp.AAC.1
MDVCKSSFSTFSVDAVKHIFLSFYACNSRGSAVRTCCRGRSCSTAEGGALGGSRGAVEGRAFGGRSGGLGAAFGGIAGGLLSES